MSKSDDNLDRLMKHVQADMLQATPGERAIVSMLGVVAQLLSEIGSNQEKLTEQFSMVTNGGSAMLTEKS